MKNDDPKLFSWGAIQRALLRHHNGAERKLLNKSLTQDQLNRLYVAGFTI